MLDIGCNGGFYSIEMKRRGAEPRGRHRFRRGLPGAGAVRRRGQRRRDRVPGPLGLRRRRAGRALRRRAVHGRALPPAPSAAGAGPDPRACRAATCWCSSPCSAAARDVEPLGRGLSDSRRARFSTEPGYPEAALRRASIRAAIRPTGGFPTAPAPKRCCAAPASRSSSHPEEEVYVCRRSEPQPGDGRGLSAAATHGSRRDDRSGR